MLVPRASILRALAPLPALTCFGWAHAEVRIEGTRDSVRIEIDDASLQEAFDALSKSFGVLVHNPSHLDRRINGSYRGSLRQVIGAFLAGYGYAAVRSVRSVVV